MEGKVAIVSGSARGIGAATCVELASRGALVIVNYPWPSQQVDAEKVLETIKLSGAIAADQCRAIEADMSTLGGPQQLINEAVRLVGRPIDILVNNAGIAIMRPLKDITLDQWDMQIDLNNSRIVNLSSVGARQGFPGSTVYSGTKSMIESFTRCWALELGPKYHCTVNAVEPGPTNTAGFTQSGPNFLENIQPLLEATPMGPRMAEPSEIAYAIAFLCEERSGWITGACLPVNGGFSMP
ncbi:hypothetical protein CLAIMM_07101 [Cladophialophora immunda]|nr:hypothetical protein CLAIMM_07101 [Cladophialophora immunda]